MERFTKFLFEPGAAKTPAIAVSGWLTWSVLHGLLEALVLVGTVVIVAIHSWNAVARQWCPKRRTGECGRCPLNKTILCPKGTEKE